MYVDAKYMDASMDAFEQILLAIQETRDNVLFLADTVMDGFADITKQSIKSNSLSSKTDTASIDKLTQSVTQLSSSIKDLNSINKANSDPSKMASGLSSISKAIKSSSSDIFDSIPFYKKNTKYIDGIIENTQKILDISKNYKESDVKKMSDIGDFLETISGSIFKFSSSLAASSVFILIGAPISKVFTTIIEEISEMAMVVSKRKKSIENATHSINHIALSLVAFSGSIAASSLLLSTVGIDDIAPMLLMVGGIALTAYTFNEIGESGKDIVKGSIAVLTIAASLALFSASLAFSSSNLPSIEDYGKLALFLGGTALIYDLVGDHMFGNIIKGSIAFGFMGLSMIALAFPISILANTLSENPDTLWQLPLTLTGLGLVFAGAGAIFEFILLGSLAFAAIGGTLWLFGKGLGAIADAVKGYDSDNINNIENAIRGVITGFGTGFSELSLVQIAALPLTIPLVGLMGLGLVSLGLGLKMYRKYAGDWTSIESGNLKYTIQSITEAYAVAGSTEGQNQLFGLHFGDNAVERGIESTMKMGKNLERLGAGIKTWLDMKLGKEDIQKLSDNVSTVLNTIPAIFASIGANQRNSKNQITLPLGVKIGIPFTDNDVELGIESTEDIGSNLKDLADGIAAWKNMKLKKEDLQAISNNVSTVLNTIPAIFASIGANQRNSSNQITLPLGVKIGIPFTDNDVELGIESTEKMGKNLKDLAEGVFAWKEGKNGFSAKDLPAIKDNIRNILTAIPSVFAAIGKKDKESDGWFSDSDMEQGIDIISDIADPLKKMIELVNMTKNIKNPQEQLKNMGSGIAYLMSYTSVGLKKISENEIEKMDDMVKPLAKLVDVLQDVNDVMKKHFENIAKLPKQYLENLKSWSESLKNISEVNSMRLQENLESFGHSQNVKVVNTNYGKRQNEKLGRELLANEIQKTQIIEQRIESIKEKPQPQKAEVIKENKTVEILEKKIEGLQKSIDSMAAAITALVGVAGQQNMNLQQMTMLLQTGIKVKPQDGKF